MKKYEQLAELIKENIADKVYVERIPSERKLSEMHEVSVNTVKNALALLQKQGFIYTKPGSGHYIKNPNVYNFLNFDNDISDREFSLESDILSFEIVRADTVMSEVLEIKEGDLIYKIRRIRKHLGEAKYIENVAIPYNLFPDLNQAELDSSLVTYMQEAQKEDIEYTTNLVEAINITTDQASLLKVEEGSPALLIRSQSFLKSGLVVAYYVNIHVNSSFSFIKYLNS